MVSTIVLHKSCIKYVYHSFVIYLMYLCGIFAWHFVIIYFVKPINDEIIMKKTYFCFCC